MNSIFQSFAQIVKSKANITTSIPLRNIPYLIGNISNNYSIYSDTNYSYYLNNNWPATITWSDIPYIKDQAFYDSDYYMHFRTIQSLNLPICSWIGKSAFKHSTASSVPSLQYISAPELTYVGYENFKFFSNLTTVYAPKLTAIDQLAFYNCSNLTSFTNNFNNCTQIDRYAFYGVKSNFGIIDGYFPNLYSLGSMNNILFTSCSSFNMPCLTNILSYAFASLSSRYFTFNFENVISIGSNAFRNASLSMSLAQLTNCTNIESSAFYGTYITGFLLDAYSSDISNYLYTGMVSLEYLSGPYITSISSSISLYSYYLPRLEYLYSNLLKSTATCLTSFISPKYIGNNYAASSSLTHIINWNNISVYEAQAFYCCSDSTPINISYSGSKLVLGQGCFQDFLGLQTMSIVCTDTLYLSQSIFNTSSWHELCPISYLYIEASSIYTYASTNSWYKQCLQGVPNIYFNAGIVDGLNAYSEYKSISRNVTIGPKCKIISSCAFGYNQFTNFTFDISNNIEQVGSSAFLLCRKLSEFVAEHCTSIATRAFEYCYNLTSLSLPNLQYLGIGAFEYDYRISYFELPSAISSLNGAFNGCSGLTLKILYSESVLPIKYGDLTSVPYVMVPASQYVNYLASASWSTYFTGTFISY